MPDITRNPTIVDKLIGIGYAPLTVNSSDEYVYDDITWLPDLEGGGREFTATPQGEPIKIYANGKAVIMFKKRSGYEIKVTLMSLLDDVKEAWLGQAKTTTGYAEYATSRPDPRFALLAAYSLYNSDQIKVETYFCCTAEDPERKAKGDSEDFDPDFPEYTIKAVPRKDDKLTMAEDFVSELPTSVTIPTIPSAASLDNNTGGNTGGNGGS